MERIDDLQINNLTLVQDDALYSFTGDAVLLADFARVRAGETVCDFGAGSGVIAVLLASKCPGSGEIFGFEIQRELFELGVRNVERNGLSSRVRMFCTDLRNASALIEAKADVVVCNPPYFKRNAGETGGNPSRARGRHEIDVTLPELCASVSRTVRSGGRFYVVYPAERLAELIFTLKSFRLEPKRMRAVAVRAGAAPHLFLVEAQKDGGEGVRHLPALYLFEGDGESEEIRQIYRRERKED